MRLPRFLTHTKLWNVNRQGVRVCACDHPENEHHRGFGPCAVPMCPCVRAIYTYRLVKR